MIEAKLDWSICLKRIDKLHIVTIEKGVHKMKLRRPKHTKHVPHSSKCVVDYPHLITIPPATRAAFDIIAIYIMISGCIN